MAFNIFNIFPTLLFRKYVELGPSIRQQNKLHFNASFSSVTWRLL
jgi:hypothetical protein